MNDSAEYVIRILEGDEGTRPASPSAAAPPPPQQPYTPYLPASRTESARPGTPAAGDEVRRLHDEIKTLRRQADDLSEAARRRLFPGQNLPVGPGPGASTLSAAEIREETRRHEQLRQQIESLERRAARQSTSGGTRPAAGEHSGLQSLSQQQEIASMPAAIDRMADAMRHIAVAIGDGNKILGEIKEGRSSQEAAANDVFTRRSRAARKGAATRHRNALDEAYASGYAEGIEEAEEDAEEAAEQLKKKRAAATRKKSRSAKRSAEEAWEDLAAAAITQPAAPIAGGPQSAVSSRPHEVSLAASEKPLPVTVQNWPPAFAAPSPNAPPRTPMWPGAATLAGGGKVRGEGHGDTVPAMLTPGERVLTPTTAAKPEVKEALDLAEGKATHPAVEGEDASWFEDFLSETATPPDWEEHHNRLPPEAAAALVRSKLIAAGITDVGEIHRRADAVEEHVYRHGTNRQSVYNRILAELVRSGIPFEGAMALAKEAAAGETGTKPAKFAKGGFVGSDLYAGEFEDRQIVEGRVSWAEGGTSPEPHRTAEHVAALKAIAAFLPEGGVPQSSPLEGPVPGETAAAMDLRRAKNERWVRLAQADANQRGTALPQWAKEWFARRGDARAVRGFAGGGGVSGDTDTVPAMLTPGEYVLSKQDMARPDVQSVVGGLEKGKSGVQHFARGGRVSPKRAAKRQMRATRHRRRTHEERLKIDPEYAAEDRAKQRKARWGGISRGAGKLGLSSVANVASSVAGAAALGPAGMIAAGAFTAVTETIKLAEKGIKSFGEAAASIAAGDAMGLARSMTGLAGQIPLVGGLIQGVLDAGLNAMQGMEVQARRLAQVSAPIAIAVAQFDVQKILRDIQTAPQREAGLIRGMQARNDFENRMNDIMTDNLPAVIEFIETMIGTVPDLVKAMMGFFGFVGAAIAPMQTNLRAARVAAEQVAANTNPQQAYEFSDVIAGIGLGARPTDEASSARPNQDRGGRPMFPGL